MKKIIILSLVLFSLAGCGEKSEVTEKTSESEKSKLHMESVTSTMQSSSESSNDHSVVQTTTTQETKDEVSEIAFNELKSSIAYNKEFLTDDQKQELKEVHKENLTEKQFKELEELLK